jgi:shikimate kinase
MIKTYLVGVSRNISCGAIFSFTGTGPVSFGICAEPREFS